jgi:hypothetical protein
MREEQPKRDDHHKRAATISNAEIKMINPKDNYFLKCKIREWETFNSRDVKIRCNVMFFDQLCDSLLLLSLLFILILFKFMFAL